MSNKLFGENFESNWLDSMASGHGNLIYQNLGGNNPACYVNFSSNQSISCGASVWSKLNFNNVIFNVGTCWDTTNHYFIAPEDGYYIITVNIVMSLNAGPSESSYLRLINSGDSEEDAYTLAYEWFGRQNLDLTHVFRCNQGDTITPMVTAGGVAGNRTFYYDACYFSGIFIARRT